MTIPRVLFSLAGITDSPVCKIENESKINFEGCLKSLFFFEIIRDMFFENSLTKFTFVSSKFASAGSIWHILYSSSRHCLTKYDLGRPSVVIESSWLNASPTQNLSNREFFSSSDKVLNLLFASP